MRQFGLLWVACLGWACCLGVGELAAQQAAPRAAAWQNQAESSVSAGRPRPGQMAHLSGMHQRPAVSEPSYIAVIGAVKTPTVFETTERSIPLKTLIERAGGETAESLGTVRIMEQGKTRFMTDLQSHPQLQVTDGQVIFVVPLGGRLAKVADTRQAPRDRFVLISGLVRGPLLFNIGNQSRTFGDLLQLLGQSPELVARQQVNATLPHGQWVELQSLLVHNTVIHFNPEAVSVDGVREAVGRGFHYEAPVKLDTTAMAEPTEARPSLAEPAPTMPVIRSQPVPAPTTPTVTSDAMTQPAKTDIEPAGSSIQFDDPLPFPTPRATETDAAASQPDGRAPLFLPKTWQNPEDTNAEEEADDTARVIERTSAKHSSPPSHIVTVSAEAEALSPDPPQPTPVAASAPLDTDLPAAASAGKSSSFTGPNSWLALLVIITVAIVSVIVSRSVPVVEDEAPKADLFTSKAATATAAVVAPTPAPAAAPKAVTATAVTPTPTAATTLESVPEEDQRFLQRLILNKIPLVEEEATLPPVDRLHGMAIGGRRLVVHEAHEGVAGPHFQVRDPSDTRDIELRLRRLLRADRSSTKHPPVVVMATEAKGTRASRVSPLEKALRTVGRGDAQ